MLVPMIGLVQVGSQALADRYMYLPQIGLLIAVVWAANDLFAALGIVRARKAAVAGAVIAACATLSFAQVRHWRDSISLFEHTLRVTSFNGIAHANLGLALIERGRHAEAEQHFRAILGVVPDDPTALANLGATLVRQGRYAEAEPPLRRALGSEPDNPKIMGNLGVALSLTGRAKEAVPLFEAAIQQGDDSAESRLNYAVALANTGQIERAREEARAALSMDPNFEKARRFLEVLDGRRATPGSR
jgi:tetratricopeptide (TPR) repeat protein